MGNITLFFLIAIVLLVIIFAKKALVIIPQSETKIIERLGRYRDTLNPGINLIIPFIDNAKNIVALKNGRYVYTSRTPPARSKVDARWNYCRRLCTILVWNQRCASLQVLHMAGFCHS